MYLLQRLDAQQSMAPAKEAPPYYSFYFSAMQAYDLSLIHIEMCIRDSIYPVYTDHIALWTVFVVCAGVLFDRLCKCICFKWRFHEVLGAVLFSDKSGAVSGYYGEFRRQKVTV